MEEIIVKLEDILLDLKNLQYVNSEKYTQLRKEEEEYYRKIHEEYTLLQKEEEEYYRKIQEE